MKIKRHIKGDGFTLLESLFAAVLIGLVIAALAASSGAFTMANAAAVDLSTAEFLIEEIRELTAHLPFADLASLAGSHSPPIDVSEIPMMDFDMYKQQVAIVSCGDEFNAITNNDFVRITVTVLKNNLPVSEASWIRANLD